MTESALGDTLFGLPLLTHRDRELGADVSGYFMYEGIIAAIAVTFFRMTIHSTFQEPLLLRLAFGLALGFLAWNKKPYTIIVAFQIFSYMVPLVFSMRLDKIIRKHKNAKMLDRLLRLLLIGLCGSLSLGLSRWMLSGNLMSVLAMMTPAFLREVAFYLIPFDEMMQAHEILSKFVEDGVLKNQLSHLLFVTFNIQVGMGYLGIDFLRKEQARRNQLVRMDMTDDTEGSSSSKTTMNGQSNSNTAENVIKDRSKQLESSRRFQRGAVPFILGAAIPYMFQIIAFGNMNMYAFTCFQHDVHRAVRLSKLFSHDSHLVAMANDSPMSPDAYASSMDNVVSTCYDFFNHKLFSLPKVLLLPGIILRQPMLVAKITPLIFGADWLKGRIMAFLTTRIETLNKEAMKAQAMRTKVEAFDMKNAELLQRSGQGSTEFTHIQWEKLTVSIQQKSFMASFLLRTKRFFNWIQHHFVFSVLIDCALAQLIAIGKIVSAEIWVFSRAIEDAVDTVLMRSRAESELARLMTDVEKLQELAGLWDRTKGGALIPCDVSDEPHAGITLQKLHYSRGTASVNVDKLNLPTGVYALTGANGSGKSTLFRVLMSCSTNEVHTDLPSSIILHGDTKTCSQEEEEGTCAANDNDALILMPSADVSEISQNFYWPLYTRPIDWIHQKHLPDNEASTSYVVKVAILLEELEFMQTQSEKKSGDAKAPPTSDGVKMIMGQLTEEKEDWFSDLSGGQKSKVELVRKVFIHETCPKVLLIDETFAPLDPVSKSLVMAKIKSFCVDSVVLVIYHTDVQGSDGSIQDCVPNNNFFDHNIHLENRTLNIRPVC